MKDMAPFISQKQLEAHYEKHAEHITRLNVYNKWMAAALEDGNLEKVTELQQYIKYNGGAHLNFELYWEGLMSPNLQGGQEPKTTSKLGAKIKETYGSMVDLKYLINCTSWSI